jgi:hypothetical protein
MYLPSDQEFQWSPQMQPSYAEDLSMDMGLLQDAYVYHDPQMLPNVPLDPMDVTNWPQDINSLGCATTPDHSLLSQWATPTKYDQFNASEWTFEDILKLPTEPEGVHESTTIDGSDKGPSLSDIESRVKELEEQFQEKLAFLDEQSRYLVTNS